MSGSVLVVTSCYIVKENLQPGQQMPIFQIFIIVSLVIGFITFGYVSNRYITNMKRTKPMKRICKEHVEYTIGCRMCPFGYHDEY